MAERIFGFDSEHDWHVHRAMIAAARGGGFDDVAALEKAAKATEVVGFAIGMDEALEEIRALRRELPKIRKPRDYRTDYRRKAG